MHVKHSAIASWFTNFTRISLVFLISVVVQVTSHACISTKLPFLSCRDLCQTGEYLVSAPKKPVLHSPIAVKKIKADYSTVHSFQVRTIREDDYIVRYTQKYTKSIRIGHANRKYKN